MTAQEELSEAWRVGRVGVGYSRNEDCAEAIVRAKDAAFLAKSGLHGRESICVVTLEWTLTTGGRHNKKEMGEERS